VPEDEDGPWQLDEQQHEGARSSPGSFPALELAHEEVGDELPDLTEVCSPPNYDRSRRLCKPGRFNLRGGGFELCQRRSGRHPLT
jgi:hypothetical protein